MIFEVTANHTTHPATTTSAWYLFRALSNAKPFDSERFIAVTALYLQWLLSADPDSLSADQRFVRGQLQANLSEL